MNILLGVTGSVAATLTIKLCRELVKLGKVKLVPTKSSMYFFDYFAVERELDPNVGNYKYIVGPSPTMCLDEMEWPSNRYRKTQDIPHITLGQWADILVIAPLTANTMAKMVRGIADNLLTSLYLAWSFKKSIVIAPAMNTNMWSHPATQENLEILRRRHGPGLGYVRPMSKKLACGDEGLGAMADIEDIVKIVKRWSPRS
jgi:phosphopantothenoylcysteine decarboxylase